MMAAIPSETQRLDRRYPARPWVGVGVVVMDEQARVLLVKRAHPPRAGQWGLPGGAQLLGETLFETARREVGEETGLAIDPIVVLDAIDSLHRDEAGGIEYHYSLIEILARPRGGSLRAGDDASAVAWVAPGEVASHVSWAETIRIIQLAQERLRT